MSAGAEDVDVDAGGVDGIQTFLESLPQLLISVVVIIIAYFMWTFFNSPTGTALAEALGDLVGIVTEMAKYWYVIAILVLIYALGPAIGRAGEAIASNRFQFASLRSAHQLEEMRMNVAREEAGARAGEVIAAAEEVDRRAQAAGFASVDRAVIGTLASTAQIDEDTGEFKLPPDKQNILRSTGVLEEMKKQRATMGVAALRQIVNSQTADIACYQQVHDLHRLSTRGINNQGLLSTLSSDERELLTLIGDEDRISLDGFREKVDNALNDLTAVSSGKPGSSTDSAPDRTKKLVAKLKSKK